MTINKGLKSLASDQPNFNNNNVSNLIADTNIGYAVLSYTLAKTIRTNTVLTTSQKNDLKSTINSKPYLNLGQLFDDLDLHTDKLLTGELGSETFAGSGDRGDFLEHMSLASSIETSVPTLFGYSAESIGKSIDDHFGTLRLTVSTNMNTIRDGLTFINNASLATDTTYKTSITNLTNFLNSVVADSTDFQQTLNTYASAVSTAQTNLDTALATEPYLTHKNNLILNRDKVNDQITKEIANIGSIRAYITNLVNIQSWVGMADTDKLNDIIKSTSGSTAWKSYFENYKTRFAKVDPTYTGQEDSSVDSVIQEVMDLRGLPDVTNPYDIDSVATKLLTDVRLSSKISNKAKTSEQLIEKACFILGININGKDVYSQSKLLLDNMNRNDIDIITKELQNSQEVETLD